MKSLRISALMLALGAFSICSVPAHAQQEVDPDHFDQPNTLWTHARGSKTQGHRDVTATQHRRWGTSVILTCSGRPIRFLRHSRVGLLDQAEADNPSVSNCARS
jgi:hypothetical protein